MCFILIFTQHLAAQDFLQIKYSINDITKQRETFKNEKIKSVSIKDNYSEKVFEIDIEGKVISETGTGDNSYSIIFNYDLNNNLTNFICPLAHQIFEHDNQGNVVKSFDEGYSNEFFYDRGTEINEKYSSFFEKDDLKAEINYGETTYITITWK